MKLDKVIHRLAAAPQDRVELRRVARALGNELSHERLDVLRQVRAELACMAPADDAGDIDATSYASGYVASMLDVTAEYEVGARVREDERARADMAAASPWRDVLMVLGDGPRMPVALAAELGMDRGRLERILAELRAAGLVRAHGRDALHRLTIHGTRAIAGQERGLTADVALGIRLAVSLFQHLFTHDSSPAEALGAIAHGMLPDPRAAAEAVRVWANESTQAGLISERAHDDDVRESDSIPAPVLAEGSGAITRNAEIPASLPRHVPSSFFGLDARAILRASIEHASIEHPGIEHTPAAELERADAANDNDADTSLVPMHFTLDDAEITQM